MSQHILVVENDAMIRGFLTFTLEKEGFRTTATDSRDGLFSALGQEQADLVIVDMDMPDSDGLDILRDIRLHYTMPVIVASARRRAADRQTAIDRGANAYVTKPFEPIDLIRQIRQFLTENAAGEATERRMERRSGQRRDRRAGRNGTTALPPSPPPPPPEAAHDVILNLAPKPGPVPHPVQNQQAPNSPASEKPDMLVIVLGIIVIVAMLMGGGYWYFKYLGGEISMSGADKTMQQPGSVKPQAPAQPAMQVAEPARPTPPENTPPNPQPGAQNLQGLVPPEKNLTKSVIAQPAQTPPQDIVSPVPSAGLAPPELDTEPPEPAQSECGIIPDVDWWRVKTHDQVIGYVARKHDGDWTPYIANWTKRLGKLQDIFKRGKAVKTGRGVVLQDAELAEYINQVAKRVAVIKCLAEEQEALAQ